MFHKKLQEWSNPHCNSAKSFSSKIMGTISRDVVRARYTYKQNLSAGTSEVHHNSCHGNLLEPFKACHVTISPKYARNVWHVTMATCHQLDTLVTRGWHGTLSCVTIVTTIYSLPWPRKCHYFVLITSCCSVHLVLWFRDTSPPFQRQFRSFSATLLSWWRWWSATFLPCCGSCNFSPWYDPPVPPIREPFSSSSSSNRSVNWLKSLEWVRNFDVPTNPEKHSVLDTKYLVMLVLMQKI